MRPNRTMAATFAALTAGGVAGTAIARTRRHRSRTRHAQEEAMRADLGELEQLAKRYDEAPAEVPSFEHEWRHVRRELRRHCKGATAEEHRWIDSHIDRVDTRLAVGGTVGGAVAALARIATAGSGY